MEHCYFCKGTVVKKKVKHVHSWGEEMLIFENVPAEVCTQCGETYFSPDALEAMDKEILEPSASRKSVKLPVVTL
ncbi:MAG: YgiT-type zinc finger protein [Candidatus Brocadiales bacterium]